MKTLQSQFVWISVGLSLAGFFITSNDSLLYAQTIRPAADGTGTIVLPNGNQIDISGGQRSRNGANLFHSFQEFGLSQGQIANFLASPELQAIFARVVGGNPSVIDGLLQVTGSNAHLYLLNPSGIVFGSNASLNVPGSLTATTANGVRFGTQWYDAIGANNYLNLGGSPDGLVLTSVQPGAIVNAGNLVVGTGRSLNLIGGTVVNTGSLTAPAGQITIAAVPGSRLVKLSSPGSLLSFEVNPTTPLQALPSRPTALPQLLTGGNLSHATGLTVSSSGQVKLRGSNITVNTGDVIVQNVFAQTATLSANHNLALVESQIQTTGDLNLLAADTVIVRDTIAQSSQVLSGNNLYIQGNQGIDILTLNHPNITSFSSTSNFTLVSDGIISTDSHFKSGGDFSILNRQGKSAAFVSLHDPIIITPGNYVSGGYDGASLKVVAGGSITFNGDVRIRRQADPGTIPSSDPDYDLLTTGRALVLDAGNNIKVGGVLATGSAGSDPAGPVRLIAGRDIFVAELNNTSSITPTVRNGANIFLQAGGKITIDRRIETFSAVGGSGGNLTFIANGNIQLNCGGGFANCINTVGGNTSGGGSSGNIAFTSQNGSITINGPVITQSSTRGGTVRLNAQTKVTTGSINSSATNGIGGAIEIISRSQDIAVDGALTSNGVSQGGAVQLEARQAVTIGAIDSSSTQGRGGSISATSQAGNVTANGTLSSVSTSGSGGAIDLTGQNLTLRGDITLGSRSGQGGGDLTLNTPGQVTFPSNISTNGANLVSTQSLNTLLPQLTSTINTGGGNVSFQFSSDVSLSKALSINTSGGDITLTSPGNLSVLGTLNTSSTTGTGGNISLTSVNGAVTSGDLTASGTSGGNVTVQALTAITTGRINTSATVGKGGNVLLDPIGDVQVTSIDARGGPSGSGGTVDITAQQFVRITGLIDNSNASISATGGQPGGSITIRHGGQGITPFIVGNAALNGSAGILTTGLDNSITSGSFYFTYSQSGPSGVIRIISVDPPIAPPQGDPLDRLSDDHKDNMSNYIFDIEQRFTRLYKPFLGDDKSTPIKTLNKIRDELRNIEEKSGVKPAIIYADFKPADSRECNSPGRPVFIEEKERDRLPQNLLKRIPAENDRLEIALVTAQNSVICKRIPNVTQQQIATFMDNFPAEDASLTIDALQYKQPVQQLYQWLVKELRADIDKEGIKNLVFILHPTLRSIPLPPLHDGQQLLIETYSMGYMPSMSLTNATYANIRSARALLMGTSEFFPFPESPLPSVRLELDGIQRLRQPDNRSSLYDKDFTVGNLTQELAKKKVEIVHLATHAKFSLKKAEEDSYIQFRDQKLTLATARKLDWQGVELLSLSACETAIGQGDWQLGFAGFAAKAGVKSVLASLWPVNDTATAALMLLFYDNLNSETTRIKAQALRQAQLTMLHGRTA